ncbi:MAG: GNAT family N-acetyltransferase [Gemmatimonadota bacterium]|nr:MAG: GNAT family N-acetyltransferase [Gemmatimonadota bacterium]
MATVEDLKAVANKAAGEQVAQVKAALAEAARRGIDDEFAEQLDREVAQLIQRSRFRDAVLNELDLEALARLLARYVDRLAEAGDLPDLASRQATWELLDLLRRPAVLQRVAAQNEVELWAQRFQAAVEASHLTVGPLFRQRARAYASKVLLEIPQGGGNESLAWKQVEARVEELSRALYALYLPDEPAPIAILSENRPEMALLDLACLTSGLLNVVVPANATDTDVGYILRHSKIGTVIVSDQEQYEKVDKNRNALPDLKHVVAMEVLDGSAANVLPLSELLERAGEVTAAYVRERSQVVRIDDRATVMYTSGTTGMPKGIQYSHRNLVFKRFARALALPEIGDEDVFLCYLPLFHTFGRYLEMLGCVFWGAKYCFLTNTSVEALIDGMRRYRPTVFISVPRKWIQLYEAIGRIADPLHAPDEELRQATLEKTGGRLRWGLSAAGYLDPEIFRHFQRHGTQLLSGFGMSEATGGITMTPPFRYKDNSLGVALPGIELKLAEDGELLIRGPYVMIGYLDPPDGQPSFDESGWFHTGDLMRMDEEGHIRLVDRKKEIYKNVKGQTIAPQRIENLFREFASVGRAFLVGDHKEYNTLLIYPNPDYEELDLSSMSAQDVRDHFRSLVVSVNKFVAPFERVVDFAVIERDLDSDKGELTPKGTPRRSTVVDNFADIIATLYRRTNLHVGGVDITLPNWLFQALGLTAQDIRVDGETLTLPSQSTSMAIRRLGDTEIQVGSCLYRFAGKTLNLGVILATPRLWLGNNQLVGFAPLDPDDRQRPGRTADLIQWHGRASPFEPTAADREALETAIQRADRSLMDLDHAARMLVSTDEECALNAVRLFERVLGSAEEASLAEPARSLLARGAEIPSAEVRRRAFQVLVPHEKAARYRETVARFLDKDPLLLDAETRAVLCERTLSDSKVEAFIDLAWNICTKLPLGDQNEDLATSLMDFLADYGGGHPTRYRSVRAFLVRVSLFAPNPAIRSHAKEAWRALREGFFQWLGATPRIAVDEETGQEYRWEDVIVFAEGIDSGHRQRLLSAIKNTPFLSGSVFLLFGSKVIRLTDIPPGGVWIRPLGERYGKSVYRVTVQTRAGDSFEMAANVNDSLTPEEVREEIEWLILCADYPEREPVVEEFGGHAPEQDIWSEEFIHGATLDRELRRLARRSDAVEGMAQLWPFLAWNAMSAFVDFWDRTGRRCEIAALSPTDIVVPIHDYHRGSRIVSLSVRCDHHGVLAMLQSFKDRFVGSVEREYDDLKGLVGWDVIFSSVLEVLGEQEGLATCEGALLAEAQAPDEIRSALREYVSTVRGGGFLPMRLYFAAKRYRRWARLNEAATPEARASTLQELYDTYGLDRIAKSYPEVRLRFFRETVFRDGSPELVQGLDGLIRRVRAREMRESELADAVADLRNRLTAEPEADYFLARIPFAYLRPEDTVDFVSSDLGGEYQSEIVVTREDIDGNIFRVRHALMPKEVERLHRLFLAAKLDVRFGPEHRYLVAINDREQIIGGIYYTVEEANAHLEKIVVSERYRRKGVADGLMKDFFNRLRAAGVKTLTTGFFRPEYFYSYGFKIERRYAGLVKQLDDEASGSGGAERPGVAKAL